MTEKQVITISRKQDLYSSIFSTPGPIWKQVYTPDQNPSKPWLRHLVARSSDGTKRDGKTFFDGADVMRGIYTEKNVFLRHDLARRVYIVESNSGHDYHVWYEADEKAVKDPLVVAQLIDESLKSQAAAENTPLLAEPQESPYEEYMQVFEQATKTVSDVVPYHLANQTQADFFMFEVNCFLVSENGPSLKSIGYSVAANRKGAIAFFRAVRRGLDQCKGGRNIELVGKGYLPDGLEYGLVALAPNDRESIEFYKREFGIRQGENLTYWRTAEARHETSALQKARRNSVSETGLVAVFKIAGHPLKHLSQFAAVVGGPTVITQPGAELIAVFKQGEKLKPRVISGGFDTFNAVKGAAIKKSLANPGTTYRVYSFKANGRTNFVYATDKSPIQIKGSDIQEVIAYHEGHETAKLGLPVPHQLAESTGQFMTRPRPEPETPAAVEPAPEQAADLVEQTPVEIVASSVTVTMTTPDGLEVKPPFGLGAPLGFSKGVYQASGEFSMSEKERRDMTDLIGVIGMEVPQTFDLEIKVELNVSDRLNRLADGLFSEGAAYGLDLAESSILAEIRAIAEQAARLETAPAPAAPDTSFGTLTREDVEQVMNAALSKVFPVNPNEKFEALQKAVLDFAAGNVTLGQLMQAADPERNNN